MRRASTSHARYPVHALALTVVLGACSVTYDVGETPLPGSGGMRAQDDGRTGGTAGSDPRQGGSGGVKDPSIPEPQEPIEDTADRCGQWGRGVPLRGDVGPPNFQTLVQVGGQLWSAGTSPDLALEAGRVFFDRYSRKVETTGDLYCAVLDALRDPRAELGLSHFFARWLRTGHPLSTEPRLFADDTPDRLDRLAREAVAFATRVALLPEARVADLLAGERPGELVVAAGDRPTPEWLQRMRGGGLLSDPWVLALAGQRARDGSTAPWVRGLVLRDLFLCEQPPPAPSDLPTFTFSDRTGAPYAQQVAVELLDPRACTGCHRLFTGLGLALDPFDAAGRLTTRDRLGLPHRPDLAFPFDDTRVDGPVSAGRAMSSRPEFPACFARSFASFLVDVAHAGPGRTPLTPNSPVYEVIPAGLPPSEPRVANLVAHTVRILVEKGLLR